MTFELKSYRPQLPVRRLSHPSTARTLERIRQELETFALVFPDVSFSLENTNKVRESNSTQDRVMRIPRVCADMILSEKFSCIMFLDLVHLGHFSSPVRSCLSRSDFSIHAH